MAEKKSRAAARKIKDKWKAKVWYNLLAPEMFNKQSLGEFVKGIISGDLAKTIALACKPIHPVSRVEVRKSEVWAVGEIAPSSEAPAVAAPAAEAPVAPEPAAEPEPAPEPEKPEPAPEELAPEELPPEDDEDF